MILVDFVALICVTLLVLVLLNKRAVKKFKDFFAALFGKAADDAIDSAPVAVYREKLKQKGDELKDAMVALENHHALIKQVERELSAASGEYTLFEEKVKELMGENKQDEALKYANAMAKLEERLDSLKTKLINLKAKYEAQAKKIKELKDTYNEYRDKADSLETDLELSANEAKIVKLFDSFDGKTDFNDLSEIENKIKSKIDKNESVSTVAKDLETPDLKSEIKKDLADKKAKDILAKYKKETPQ